jgi:hypothetical protein
MKVEPIAPDLEPLRVSVRVELRPEEAFALFAAGFPRWWPLATHSLGGEKAASCGIEPAAGGLVYEVGRDGGRIAWGRVLAWDPPGGLVLAWHPGRPAEQAQEVEVRFRADGSGTRVELEHRDWHRLGRGAGELHGRYREGWAVVLQAYVAGAATGGLGGPRPGDNAPERH